MIFTSGGGGGSSFIVMESEPESSTDLLLVLMDADTHLKKALIVALSAVSSCTTFSVIFCRVETSAPCPAAQATTIPNLRFLKSSSPRSRLSVGCPSVIMNTRGLQSPFTSAVVLVTSVSTFCERRERASPRAVQPEALILGCWKAESSVSGTICSALLLNVMMLRYAVSSA